MSLFSTAKVVAAMVKDDQGDLNFLEKAVLFSLKRLGPISIATKERWLFGMKTALEFYKAGIRDFLVLGAGYVTPKHIHDFVSDARVLYVDKDEKVVRESQRLIGDSDRVRYICGDINRWTEEVLPRCREFFGDSPKLGIIMVGIISFLPDEVIRRAFKSLYAWVAPGSQMVISNTDADVIKSTPGRYARYLAFKFIYALVGNRNYPRTDAQLKALMLPWRVTKTVAIFPHNPVMGPGRKAYSTGYIAIKAQRG